MRVDGTDEVVEEVSGDNGFARQFTQSEGAAWGVLPCIDAAAREMKCGERVLVHAPADWAYSCAGLVPSLPVQKASGEPITAGLDEAAIGALAERRFAVEVELKLVGFVKGKEIYEMDASEKAVAQAKAKERGNGLHTRGEYATAVRRYERSNKCAPTEDDYAKLKEAGVDVAERKKRRAESDALKLSCYLNMAACQLKMPNARQKVAASCPPRARRVPTTQPPS